MVEEPHFIQKIPKQIHVDFGDEVRLYVRVLGNPEPKVSWYKDGHSIPTVDFRNFPERDDAIRHRQSGNDKFRSHRLSQCEHELVIYDGAEDDEGEYECRIYNHLGQTSCFGEVIVSPRSESPQSGLLILIDQGQSSGDVSDSSNQGEHFPLRRQLSASEQIEEIYERTPDLKDEVARQISLRRCSSKSDRSNRKMSYSRSSKSSYSSTSSTFRYSSEGGGSSARHADDYNYSSNLGGSRLSSSITSAYATGGSGSDTSGYRSKRSRLRYTDSYDTDDTPTSYSPRTSGAAADLDSSIHRSVKTSSRYSDKYTVDDSETSPRTSIKYSPEKNSVEEMDDKIPSENSLGSMAELLTNKVLVDVAKTIKSGQYTIIDIHLDSDDDVGCEEQPKVDNTYVVISDYTDPKSTESIDLSEGQIVKIVDSSNENRWKVKTTGSRHAAEGYVSSHYLERKESVTPVESRLGRVISSQDNEEKHRTAKIKREKTVSELTDTEADYVKDIMKVVDNYYEEFDKAPRELKDLKDDIFGNFKEIAEFHKNVLTEGVEYHANEPSKLGKTFLRLERDFDMHSKYCQNEDRVQELLSKSSTKELVQEISDKLGDDKTLAEHLKLPIQRINDYQVILKDLIKTTAVMGESTSDLERALDFMSVIKQTGPEVKLLQSIEGYTGDIKKLGPILQHGWLTITDNNDLSLEKYAFLFKDRLLITNCRHITCDDKSYILKDIVQLADVEVKDRLTSVRLIHKDTTNSTFPLQLQAPSRAEKQMWMDKLTTAKQSADVTDMGDDELRVATEHDISEAKEDKRKAYDEETDERIRKSRRTDDSQEPSMMLDDAAEDEIMGDSQVLQPPAFKKTLKGIVCNQGDNVSFECSLDEDSTVTWLKNNRPLSAHLSPKYEVIQNDNARALIIKDTVVDDAGLYTARAINDLGKSSSCSARLTVRDAIEIPCSPEPPKTPGGSIIPHEPYFTISFKDTELLRGTCVRFEIKARGFPDPVVEFFKDDKPLKQDERVKVTSEHKETFELIITDVKPEDAGRYSCIAVNPIGRGVTSMNVTVTDEKDYFHGIDGHGIDDHSVDGQKPEFKWFKNGHEFDASERFQVILNEDEDSLALVFQHVKPEDAGLYTCVANTMSGKIACSAELTVQGEAVYKEPNPPKIIVDLTDTEVSIGGSAMLELKCSGYPKPQITWYKDGKEVKAGGRFRFLFEDQESSALIIRNCEKDDTGTYKVVAKNELGEVTTTGELLVKVPPTFKKKMKDMSVMTDEPVKFDVEIEAKPSPEIKWYKDGHQLTESERIQIMKESDEMFAMVIDKAKPDDSGNYSCVASNDSGDVSGFGSLTVNAPPSFVRELKDIDASKGENVQFEAKVAGNPKPDVEWRKDGKKLRADDRHIKIVEEDSMTQVLSINNVKESDVGQYACRLKNEYGEDSANAKLNIQNGPRFTKEMKDIEAKENEKVKFEVKTDGSPTPNIKWYVEGTEIHESSQYKMMSDDESGIHTLTVTKVTNEVTGKYTCKVINSLGESSSSANLSMLSQPKFKTKLKDKDVNEGETVKFTVEVIGSPAPDIKWKRNGEEISIDANIKISSDEDNVYTLEIETVTGSLAGEYECTAENKFGKSSSSCNLSVASKAGFDKKFGNKNVGETEDVEFTVVIHGNPEPQVTWKKDGVRIIEDEHIEIIVESDTHKIVIRGCQTSDSGSYSCTVKNKVGGEEVEAQLTVTARGDEVKPYFMKRMKDTTVFCGDMIKFEIQIGGSPAPDVTWFKDNVEIVESSRIIISTNEGDGTHTLTVRNAEVDDTASYSCKAVNKYGQENAEASLTVKIPSEPVITGGEEIVVMEEEDIHIKMEVNGDPYPDVLWFKDHDEVKSSGRTKVTIVEETHESEVYIMKSKKSDEGDYECVASNKFGTTSKKSSVTVKSKEGDVIEREKPKFVKSPVPVVCVCGNSAQFDVKVIGSPKPMVKWFRGDDEDELSNTNNIILTRNKEDGEFSLRIKNCNFKDGITYTCMAINSYGYASKEAVLTVKAPVEPSVEGMKDKIVTDGDKVKFEVEVEGLPKPEVKWLKNDRQISESNHAKIVKPESEDESNKHQLIVSNIDESDLGKYSCVAVNAAGKAAQHAKLSFKDSKTEVDAGVPKNVAPAVTKKLPSSFSIEEGKPMVLEAKFEGEPSPEIKWTKDGEDILPNNHITMTVDPEGATKLVIESVKPEDSGRYVVKGTNDSGTKLSDSDVSVEPAKPTEPVTVEPVMKKDLKPVQFVEGETGELIAEVAGTPKPEITWLKDGAKIKRDRRIHTEEQPDGKVALVIDKVKPNDSGNYKLVAKNEAGETTSNAPVSVRPKLTEPSEEKPIMKKGLEPTKLFESEPGELIAEVSGTPKPEIKWMKDGEKVKLDRRVHAEERAHGKVALVFDKVKPSDSGNYKLIASNEAGDTVTSAPVSVESKLAEPTDEKPVMKKGLEPTKLIENEPGELIAEVSGTPKPEIKWMKDGEKVKLDRRVHAEEQPDGKVALVIDNVKPSDSGNYKLIASNEAGDTVTSAPVSVESELAEPSAKKPVMKKGLEPTKLIENEPGELIAEVSGTPDPEIKWMKDGQKVKLDRRVHAEEKPDGKVALVIDKVKPSDSGNYKLIASNEAGDTTTSAPVSVESELVEPSAKKPVIKKGLEPTKLIENEPGELVAEVSGTPKPEIKWMKDGEKVKLDRRVHAEVKPDGKVTLVIDKVKPSDSGNYKLIASNEAGDTATSAPVSVESKLAEPSGQKPVIKKGLEPTKLIENKPGELVAEVSGTPKPEIKWMKDGEKVKLDRRVHAEEQPDGKVALVIDKVKPSDSGNYKLIASNEAGDTATSAPVSVEPKATEPVIKKDLTPTELVEGETGELLAEVSGTPKPDIKWMKDGVKIKPDHRIHTEEQPDGKVALVIDKAKPSDSGNYKLIASNDVGETASEAPVSVKAAKPTMPESIEPVMKKDLVPTNLVEGEPGELLAEVSGTPMPAIKWLKDGEKIKPDRRIHMEENPDGKVALVIDKVKPDDAGNYKLVASNDAGETTSKAPVSVKQKSSKPQITKGLEPTELVEGKSGELTAEVIGTPKPDIKWMKDGEELKHDRHIRAVEKPDGKVVLVIDRVRPKDSGNYKLVAKNEAGEVTSDAPVTVKPKPEEPDFIKRLRPTELKEGIPGKLEVIVTGKPFPQIEWSKDGKKVKLDDRIHEVQKPDGKVALIFDKVKPEDAGRYEVTAKNDGGEVKSSAPVTVADRVEEPHFIKRLQPMELIEGQSARVEAQVSGLPKPNIKWTKDGEVLTSSGRMKIEENDDGTIAVVIDKVHLDDEGAYKIVASNVEGRVFTSAPVSVIPAPKKVVPPPSFTVKLKPVELIEGQSGKIEATVTADQTPKISWFKDSKVIRPDDRVNTEESLDGKLALIIDSVRLDDAGQYKVVAKNENGEDSCFAQVTVLPKSTKKEPIFTDELLPTELIEGSPGVLKAKLCGNPKPDVRWMKDGEDIVPSKHLQPEEKPDGTVKLLIDNAKPSDAGEYVVAAENELGDASSGAPVTVVPASAKRAKKPEISEGLKPTKFEVGKQGDLSLVASGEPEPTVKWLKDGEELTPSNRIRMEEKPDGRKSLKIREVIPDDASKYTAEVSNPSGTTSSSAPVSVVGGDVSKAGVPMFINPLLEVEVKNDYPIKLRAKVSIPLPEIKWLKDGKPIKAIGDHIKMSSHPDGTVELKIDHSTPGDQGTYTCIASNDSGKAKSEAPVRVLVEPKGYAPSIVEGLKAQEWTVGKSGKLRAKIEGSPQPQVAWYKDGIKLMRSGKIRMEETRDGEVSLTVDDVKADDQGTYQVVATNAKGDAKSTAPVDVHGPPRFVEPLSSIEVVDGDTARLECKLSGFPTPDLKWLRNGKKFTPDGVHIRESRRPDGTVALFIDRCSIDDACEFSCVATNAGGEATTSGDLKVTERKKVDKPESQPMILTPLRDITVKDGESFMFETRVSGNPLPQVIWTKDDQPISSSDNISITFDGKRACLKVRESNPQHTGAYQIKVINTRGETESRANAKVSTRSAPKFIQTLSDTEVKIGDVAELVCKLRGEPDPAVTWYFDNYALTSGYKYDIRKDGELCTLLLKHPRPNKDSGRYQCKAKNEVGEDRTSCRLKILDHEERGEAPIFLKKIGNYEVLEGMTAKFTACVSGSPDPDVKWFRNGEQIESGDFVRIEVESYGLHRLIIKKASAQDAGEYRCSISNKHGSDQCTGQLTFQSLEDLRKARPIPTMYDDEPIKDRRPARDEIPDTVKYKEKGVPQPLSTPPIIFRMTDDYVSLAWRPSIPYYPRVPVTYSVEMNRLPSDDWKPYRSGIKDSCCDIRGLEPNKDYRFRVRVENKFGISDPSPYCTALRSKVRLPSPTPKQPRDYEIDHEPPEKMAAAPRFVRREEDVMYGIKGQPVSIEFWVYGYPQPECNWFFNGDKIEMGVKYDKMQDRNGQVTLFIVRMTDEMVGTYLCVAINEHGEARQKIKLKIAERPEFIKRLEETTVMIRKSGKLQCRVIGVPMPTIKWFKDWHPLSESNRIKITWMEPDTCTLQLNDSILKDSGLYSCSAVNIAGHASTSANLMIEESADQYDLLTYRRPYITKPKNRPVEELYDIGDEIGRGTQSIVYHAVKRDTGKSFAAKCMNGTDKFREWMDHEMDIMNQLSHPRLVRLFDALQTPRSLSLICELCGGGELLDNIINKGTITESEVAHYMRQILEGLQHMHEKRIGHLGLSIGDILVSKVNGDTIKIGDFGLAARLPSGREFLQEYGHPEYVAPEIANKQPVTMSADMWSVGVIAYTLLSGISPFLGDNDRETLTRVQEGKINFFHDAFAEVSDDARDFLSKLLVFDPFGRMDVLTALKHPWLSLGDIPGRGDKLSNIDRLRDYRKRWRDWYSNANCHHYYRRRKLSSCFTHPSKMIYPPGEVYTPEPTPTRDIQRRPKFQPSKFDDVTFKQRVMEEPENFVSESSYQSGPDTYLLQYRDPDYTLRIRQYLRVGAQRSPNLASNLREGYWGGRSHPQPSVRERRRFTDVMDEEIDDEQKGLSTRSFPMRLRQEVGTLGYTHGQIMATKKDALQQLNRPPHIEGQPPYFREKLKDVVVQEEEEATFSCMISSDTKPTCAFFRNDGILIESQRIKITEEEDGRLSLKLCPARAYDVGVYKCVARNKHDVSVSKCRLFLGEPPGRPDCPEAEQSDSSQIYVAWSPPRSTGNTQILCYKLEYQLPGEIEWCCVADNIDHEFYVVHDLNPESPYQFRVTANNKFGWGEPSCSSEELKTNIDGSPSIKITKAKKYQQQMTETGRNISEDLYQPEKLDYQIEMRPIQLKESPPLDLYNFIAELSRGRFSIVLKTFAKEDKKYYAAKLIQSDVTGSEERARDEYKILSSLRHEKIACLYDACYHDGMYILIMEKLCGHDIMTYLTLHHYYTEDMVCKVIVQVLDALQYLHFRNIGYFNLQPDNVLVVSPRNLNIKLVDFSYSQKFSDVMIFNVLPGDEEYFAPEILKKADVDGAADVWGVAVLAYILLSGVSPFRDDSRQETISNVTYVRYRFEYLYKEATQETTRFLMHIFKRTPSKRPTVSECLDHKWLTPSEFMLKRREKAVFVSTRLNQFAEEFHEAKKKATPEKLRNPFGMSFSS